MYRTDISRKYPPYPEFPNEKYVALAAKYRLIDRDYKLAVLNRVLCHVTYLEDGSSHTMWKQYAKTRVAFYIGGSFALRTRLLQRARYSTASITMPRVFSRKSPH